MRAPPPPKGEAQVIGRGGIIVSLRRVSQCSGLGTSRPLRSARPARGRLGINAYAASTSATACSAEASSRAWTPASGSPRTTASPRFAGRRHRRCGVASSFVRRPAPRCTAALPIAIAPSAVMYRPPVRHLADGFACAAQPGLGRRPAPRSAAPGHLAAVGDGRLGGDGPRPRRCKVRRDAGAASSVSV